MYKSTPQIHKLFLSIQEDWFQDNPPRIPKSVDTQMPHVQWNKTTHVVTSPHVWTPKFGSKTGQVFIEEHLYISGSSQFKLMLVKDQL